MPPVVVISGMAGAGKSTLGELLREKYGLVHFDADCWRVGRDPVAEAGAVITPEDFAAAPERAPEVTKLTNEYKTELIKGFQGGTPDLEPIERFYTALVAKVEEVRAANPGKGIVMSRGIFLRQERDVLRAVFAKTPVRDNFACVVLCALPALLGKRRVERAKREAAEAGKTIEEHVMSYPASLLPGDTFEAKMARLGDTSAGVVAKEADADEPGTFNVRLTEETTKDVMCDETAALLGLSATP